MEGMLPENKNNFSWGSTVGRGALAILRALPVFLLSVLVIGLLLVVGALAITLPYSRQVKAIAADANQAKSYLSAAESDLRAERFHDASLNLRAANQAFGSAYEKAMVLKEKPVAKLPFINDQVRALNDILYIGEGVSNLLTDVSVVGEEVLLTLKSDKINLSGLDEAQRKHLLGLLVKMGEDLKTSQFQIDSTKEALVRLQKYKNSAIWSSVVGQLDVTLPEVFQGFDNLQTASLVVPELLGYDNEKTYLFLMQNNDELRPSGGFIGTYGILKWRNGEIVSFFTDNIYNIDGPAEKGLSTVPPEPIKKYLGIGKWFMRDANWWPDFPTSVKKVEELYHLEGGREKIDGVIAINPNVIADLLGYFGEIQIEGIKFNKDNFTDELQYQVESGFYRRGISREARKDIIGELSNELQTRIYALPSNQWSVLFGILQKNLDGKFILLNSANPLLQAFYQEHQWAGEVSQAPGDYLQVVDANLAALKTDRVMKRSVAYRLKEDATGLQAEVRLSYKNEGQFDWKTTRYRTYNRVYVPQGSVLRSATINGQEMAVNEIAVTEESGKTAFGYFFEVEPQQTVVITYKYQLPNSLAQSLKAGDYVLTVQKQAGLIDLPITLDLNFNRTIKLFSQGSPVHNLKSSDTIMKDETYTVVFQ
jgi:hypothetical protein